MEDKDYGVMATKPWVWREQYENELYDVEQPELPIKVQFLDLPDLHCYDSELSNKFFESIGESSNLDIF